jgi:hypothetical protein
VRTAPAAEGDVLLAGEDAETLREHYRAPLEDESAEPRFFRPDF